MYQKPSEPWSHPSGVGTPILRLLAWTWPAVAKYTHGSLIAITNSEGHYFLVRHRWRERNAVGFPGGTHAFHESPRAAAIREARQETGLNIDQPGLRLIATYDQPWAWHYDHLFA